MILSTTPTIEGKTIDHYHGIVTGEAIIGANLFKDLFAGIRDLVGGRSAAYEKELQNARRIAMEEMTERANNLGADAIVTETDGEHHFNVILPMTVILVISFSVPGDFGNVIYEFTLANYGRFAAGGVYQSIILESLTYGVVVTRMLSLKSRSCSAAAVQSRATK